MRRRRFFLFWLCSYVLGFGLMIELSLLLAPLSHNIQLALELFVGLLLTLFATWLVARGEKKETAHRWRFGALWVTLTILLDAVVVWAFYGASPFSLMTNALAWGIYGMTYFAAVIGFSLALLPRASAAGTPSPRSELASQLSSVPRPRERE